MNKLHATGWPGDVLCMSNRSPSRRKIMEKISLHWLVTILTTLLIGISTTFGNYILNDLSAQIKDIDSKLDTSLTTLKEHGDSLLQIRSFLSFSDPKFKDVVSSINKLKPLNEKEFDVLKSATLQITTHNTDAAFEILSTETKELLDKHNIDRKDLDTYRL